MGIIRIIKSILITLIIFLSSFTLYAQPQWIEYHTWNSGLPDNTANSILIDSNNVKWISTLNGFARLQGNSWYVYDTLNSGLPQNLCGGVTKDKRNNIWLGTYNKGIAKFDGVNWTIYNEQNTGVPINHECSIGFDSSNTKWIGEFGGLFKFNDTNWIWYKHENSGIPSNMVMNIYVQGNIVWVGTIDAGLARFDGQNWIIYDYYNSGLPSNWIYKIKADRNNNIWIATFFGGVAKFNYGQNNWTIYNTENSGLHDNNTFSIYIDNNNVKWIGASGCAIYNDTTWQIIPAEFIHDVGNFAKDKYGNMWICSTGGLYVYNPNGVIGINQNNSSVPEEFSLYQNFPNPFNPVTKINYDLPKSGMVKLVVYDILGREIKTLVNEFRQAGKYSVEFDGSNFSSGVYFYKISAGDFSSVKKMILLK